tara:strand:+ start:182 stop:664 length:483 start_codon:yes stop_codon:yes gene_type:complete
MNKDKVITLEKILSNIDRKLYGKKILIISAKYYEDIVNNLEKQALNYLKKFNDVNVNLFTISGAFEIPHIINRAQENFDGFIALGCIIRGETYHFELIATQVARKIMDLSVNIKKPIGFGIIACDNMDQAIARSNIDKKNKGEEAAKACYELIPNKEKKV